MKDPILQSRVDSGWMSVLLYYHGGFLMALDGSWHQFVSVAGSEKVKSAILGMLAFALA